MTTPPGRRRRTAPARSGSGLDRSLADLLGGLDADGPYRHPTTAERDAVRAAVGCLLDGNRSPALSLETGVDVSGRRYLTATAAQRAWGLLVLDGAATPPHLVVEVPHPAADVGTEHLGLALFRAVPGSALLVAGAHRRAADADADVAHQPRSLFHALSLDLASRGATQVQLHGFDDASLPGTDVIVSAGAGAPDASCERLADRLAGTGFDVRPAWNGIGGPLEGRTNSQGLAAAEHGYPFVHLEISRRTRVDPARRETLLGVLADIYRRSG